MIDEIARIVAGFHERAATDLEIGKFGSLETIKFNWDENFAQTEEFKRRTIGSAAFRSIKEEVERFMVENRSLFSRRIRERRVRECHGDLHSRNIFIGEHVRIFDCIEFNRRFSCCDVASEIAFFVMDLEYYGEKGLANYFVDRYLALTRDHSLLKVLDFYKCYRAYVRGKVTSFNLNDPGIPARARTEAAQTAREYFRLAARYARHFFDRPGLILTIGLPGVGKTYLASRLARKLDCYHLRSDILRKELTEVPVGEHRFEGMNKGIYTSNISARTYDEMLRRRQVLPERRPDRNSRRHLLDGRWPAQGRGAGSGLQCTVPDGGLRLPGQDCAESNQPAKARVLILGCHARGVSAHPPELRSGQEVPPCDQG